MKLRIVVALFTSSSVVLGAPIVKNGSFEQWENGKPLYWEVGAGIYEKEATVKIDGRYAVRKKADKMQNAASIHDRLKQVVTLKPNQRYTFSCYMSNENTGTYLFRITPVYANGTQGDPVLSLRSWSWPMPYTCIAETFTTGDAVSYIVDLIQYSDTKYYNYLDDVKIVEVSNESSSEKAESDPEVFTQSVMREFSDEKLSEHARVLNELSITLTRNETESAAIIFRAGAKKLYSTTVKLTRPLQNSSGGVIPAENITIRSCIDSVLPVAKPRFLLAHKLAAWQVFVKSDESILPGEYTGSLVVESNGDELKTIPFTVQIIDILLPEPAITFGTYHSLGYFPGQYINREYVCSVFEDMKAHGMNSVSIYNNPEDNSEGEPDYKHNHQFNPEFIPAKFADWSKEKDPTERYDGVAWSNRFNFGLEEEMSLGVKTGLLSKNHPVLWLVTKPGRYNWGGMNPRVLGKVLPYWKSQENWPEPLFYVLDEPSGMPEREKQAKEYFNGFKDAGIKVRTVTAHPDPDELGELYDVWILGSSHVNYHHFEKAVQMDREFWMYNCSMPNNNAPYHRAMYGFSAIASRVTGVWTWAYYDAGVQFVSGENGELKDTTATRLSKVGLSPEGPVPTIAWEAIRDGTEDYRLTQHFLSLYKKARAEYRSRLEAVSKSLSDTEISLLRKIDKQQYSKPKDGATVYSWETPDAEKKKAAVEFARVLELEHVLDLAYRAKTALIDSIPISLAPAGRMPTDSWKEGYKPDLGEIDPASAAEVKRLALIPAILNLQKL